MFQTLLKKVFGSRNDRLIKRLRKQVAQIHAWDEELRQLTDLAARTPALRAKLTPDDPHNLDELLPEAFALVREASQRVLGMRHFDVQLIGGMVLHQGRIAEMRTGEGKTLVATLAAYLNALPGKGVHVVTVNDYLARRDAQWMGPLYHALGLSVGVVNGASGQGPDNASFCFDPDYTTAEAEAGYPQLKPCTRREAYACDITYGTNNEFGFDYLRDNMAFTAEQRVQRRHFAIVDEVDSILIDEARTPLIISGPAQDSSALYQKINGIPGQLTRQEPITNDEGKPDFGPGDYSVDEKSRQVFLSDQGHEQVENLLMKLDLLGPEDSLYDAANILLLHHVNAALRAHVLFQRNVDYIVRNREIVIIDEFTGRSMPGRRWSEGLHQAIEAKEQVPIQQENQTLASTTFQNYFRLYDKLSGMTGTADTEAFEFQQIYALEVVVIPTNQPMSRDDQTDLIYLTQTEKFAAIVDDIRACVERGQPVLVGTASIEISEKMSQLLDQADIRHQVLNAKQHEREALIVAEAGRPGAVTIATNMAGRGTDIVLGGNLEVEMAQLGTAVDAEQTAALRQEHQERQAKVLTAGGLRVIGTERHESRRIDNQLRGRSGRQGDPGSSRFYLSLEDSLMRIFASDRVAKLMQKVGMEEGEAVEHPWVNKAIQNAQRKVEGRNFDIRKNLLEYDDVANDQRQVIYQRRDELMETDDISAEVAALREEVLNNAIDQHIPPQSMPEQWDVPALEQALQREYGLELPLQRWLDADDELYEEPLRAKVLAGLVANYSKHEQMFGAEQMRRIEKEVMLSTLDSHWKEHLAAMDYLRQGIHLRGYAQKNPKQEYKREAFEMFSHLLAAIDQEVILTLSNLRVLAEPPARSVPDATQLNYQGASAAPTETDQVPEPTGRQKNKQRPAAQSVNRAERKVGRNEPCPCGSGKKYKQCHGRL
ncbi:MAG: preprotein translocase subunit SecA [Pseudomonadota bacterium]